MPPVDDLPRVEVTNLAELHTWLAANHTRRTGVWLVVYKKHCTDRYLSWPEIVAEVLCWGWIDSRTRRVDDDRTSLLLTPRKPGSVWSATNKRIVARLQSTDRIQPSGQRLIDVAKTDGSWTWLDDVEALIVPDDLASALDERSARDAWEEAAASRRKQALYHIKSAKRAPTRTKRITQIVERCGRGEPPVS